MFRVLGIIVAGGLAAGACDFVYASVFYYAWKQISPVRIWQSVAAGVLGQDSYDFGLRSAGLGAGLHFFIAILMAAAFVLASLRLRFLARHWYFFGPLYGIFLYYAMNLAVVPLSNSPSPYPDLSNFPVIGKAMINFVGGLLIHMVVGTVIALYARRAWPAER